MSNTATYRFQVDWNRDGDFSGSNEDLTPYVTGASWNVGFRELYADVAGETALTLTLDNHDGRFSPENAVGTAAYGTQWNLRPVRVQAVYTGGTVTLWAGWTKGIAPMFGNEGVEATLTANGGRAWLENQDVLLPVMEGLRSDQILDRIMDKVHVPKAVTPGPWVLGRVDCSELGANTYLRPSAIETDFQTGAQTFAYAGDNWGSGVSALDAITDVVRAERGRFFFDRSGLAVFWNRQFLPTNTTVTATFPGNMQGMSYQYGNRLANVVTVRCYPRTLGAGASDVLWELDKPITLKPGQTKTMRVRFVEEGSDTQIAGVDIVWPNTSDGSLIVSAGTAAVRRFVANATSAEIELEQQGAVNATISTLIVRGRKLTKHNEVAVEERDGGSVYDYGRFMLDMDIPLLDDEQVARSIARYEIGRRKTPRGEVKITLINRDATALAHILARTLGDLVTVTDDRTGHSSGHVIVGEEHRLVRGTGMKHHEVTWTLEPAETVQFWLLGRAGQSELGTSTRLGF